MYRCYQCQHELESTTIQGKISDCPYCQFSLHVCFNCQHYSPTHPQQCRIPQVTRILDKKAANTCRKFYFRQFEAQTTATSTESSKKKLDDLFRNL